MCFWHCPFEATNQRLAASPGIRGHPVTNRFSKAGLGTACFALLVGSAVLFVPLAPVQAAPQERSRSPAEIKVVGSKLAQAEPTTTGSLSKAVSDEQPGCDRPRRRLWIEGEGWVVRRVSTCH